MTYCLRKWYQVPMSFEFKYIEPWPGVDLSDWQDWRWQQKKSLKSQVDFENVFKLTPDEKLGFEQGKNIFQVRTTPYYASLALKYGAQDPIRKIMMPHKLETQNDFQVQADPLGERKNNPAPRIIHRYQDRVLFLVTDFCGVYCRYCTRKHFTAQAQSFPNKSEYEQSLDYIKENPQIKEVILSGGDALTLSDEKLEKVLSDLRAINHIEIIRIGSRIPVIAPMRITESLIKIIKKYQPVYLMTHFNHPREVTAQSKQATDLFVDNGIPVMNQMVLLNGVNNHANIVRHLSRKLLYIRIKPYYMFQCDPSPGTEHLRTSIKNSMEIQKELWGHTSGLAMPNLSVDIPSGGGKAGIVPNFVTEESDRKRSYKGFDGVEAEYISPKEEDLILPVDYLDYK